MESKEPPVDLLLIKRAVDGQIIPEINDKNYVAAELTISNVLDSVDQVGVMLEHCGMNLIASLKVLREILEKKQYDQTEEVVLMVRAFLAQSLMYYKS